MNLLLTTLIFFSLPIVFDEREINKSFPFSVVTSFKDGSFLYPNPVLRISIWPTEPSTLSDVVVYSKVSVSVGE